MALCSPKTGEDDLPTEVGGCTATCVARGKGWVALGFLQVFNGSPLPPGPRGGGSLPRTLGVSSCEPLGPRALCTWVGGSRANALTGFGERLGVLYELGVPGPCGLGLSWVAVAGGNLAQGCRGVEAHRLGSLSSQPRRVSPSTSPHWLLHLLFPVGARQLTPRKYLQAASHGSQVNTGPGAGCVALTVGWLAGLTSVCTHLSEPHSPCLFIFMYLIYF